MAGNGLFTNMGSISSGGSITGLSFIGTGGNSTLKSVTVNDGLSASAISSVNSVGFTDGTTQTTASMAPYFHVSAVPEHNKTLPSEFKTQYDNGTLLGEFNYYSDGFIWQGVNEMQLSNENSVMYSMFVKNAPPNLSLIHI